MDLQRFAYLVECAIIELYYYPPTLPNHILTPGKPIFEHVIYIIYIYAACKFIFGKTFQQTSGVLIQNFDPAVQGQQYDAAQ